jgi:dihydrolipoamide dehydrogenase
VASALSANLNRSDALEAQVYDAAIIGGGPGGYAAALYAHNFGLSVALVEKAEVGGTCLHRGCIPAKAWLHTAEVFTEVARAAEFGVNSSPPTLDWGVALERKNKAVDQLHRGLSGLLKKRNVEIVAGTGRLAGPGAVDVDLADGSSRRLEARSVIIATGSVPRSIPGYPIDGERIVSSDHALDWKRQPERVAVIGAGAIGCEFASLLADLGSTVHLFEVVDQILPGADPAVARLLDRALSRRGVSIHAGVSVEPAEVTGDGVNVRFGDDSVDVDVVLVAVGRAPLTEGLGLEAAGIELEQGFVPVDLETMQTSVPGVYAVGDIVAETPQLAHAGFAEGIAAVTHIATGHTAPVDYRAVPLVVYSHPEVATVGFTEEQARQAGLDVEVHDHGFAGVGRAIIKGDTQGTVRVVVERDGPIVGASVIGPFAGELIHELMYSVGWEALPSEAAAFIHAHPTLAEAVGETLLSASGRSLH